MKKALLLLMMGLLVASCGEKKDPMAEIKAKNIEAFKAWDVAMNANDTTAFDKYLADNFIEHHPMPGSEPTREGMKKAFQEMRKGWPDMKWKYNDIWADGDYVIGHYSMTGTNTGPMMGMPPTNKPINVSGVDIVKFKDGKAIEHWMYGEDMKMMTQLGLMPPMDGSGAPPAADAAKAEEGKKEEKK